MADAATTPTAAADVHAVLTICGAEDCRFFRQAVAAAETLAADFPGQAAAPVIVRHATMAEYGAWLADRAAWPDGFAGVVPTKHVTSPLVLEQRRTAQAPFAYVGGYDAAAQRINVLGGGKLIADMGRNDRVALAVATAIWIAHILLLFFLNPQPVAWRWTVSQTGAGVGAIAAQLYFKS
jgi:hypothetical protein